MAEKTSGDSCGRSTRLPFASKNCARQDSAKNGDLQRTSSCAAKSLCSGPTAIVTMAELRFLRDVRIRLRWELDLKTYGDVGELPVVVGDDCADEDGGAYR